MPHFELFTQPQGVSLAHTATWTEGRTGILAIGILCSHLWPYVAIAPMRSQFQESCLAGDVFTGQLPTHSCFLPCRNLMLDRRAGWVEGMGQEKQRTRSRGGGEMLVAANGKVNQRENQSCPLLSERRLSRSPGWLLNSKPARNLS